MSNITVQITGQILEAKTSSFQDDNNNTQTYGKIQMIIPDMSGDFWSIENIKVRKENFGWLPDIAAMKGKEVTLNLEQSSYNGKTSNYIAQPVKKAA